MDEKTYNFRSQPYRTIYTGMDTIQRQVIVSDYEDNQIKALFFDSGGGFLHIENREYSRPDFKSYFDIGILISDWMKELGMQEQPIVIKKFFLPDLNIGVEDYPHERLLEQNPQAFAEYEKQEILAEAENWKKRGAYVIWWGVNDYWVSAEGEITDS